ncbi:uncharacterized protein [Miscanthus floridulus]|uniref:uncharacterized protein n=1 Tax=Miscanthus floridulus TaxID=154761 RepID=UPI0034581611
MKKILVHEELDKRCRQQRKDGLPLEESQLPSLSTEASDEDDKGEMVRGPLDHLPDIGETVPGASASSPVLPGGGAGADPGRKRPAEVPTLAPLKALKVNPGSTAHWVAEAQATLQCGVASAKADPKASATQGGAAEAALTQEGEGAPPPHDGEARGSDAAKVPLAAETTGTEVPGVSQAGAMEAMVPRTNEAATTEATMVEAEAPETTEAMMAEAGAPGTTDADVIMVGLPA